MSTNATILQARSKAGNLFTINLLVFISGLAALSWEVIWQLKSSLALGVSAWGTALTLAVTMGGMSAGALITGHVLKNKDRVRPVRLYGFFEIIIGLAGLCLIPAFNTVAHIDSWAYSTWPGSEQIIHLLGIAVLLCVPTFFLGSTIPVFGLAAKKFETSIAALYALNTLGAAIGVLIAAFMFIPLLGVTKTILLISTLNIVIGIVAIQMDKGTYIETGNHIKSENKNQPSLKLDPFRAYLIVFVTGFGTFALEVVWFRSFTASFLSTSSAFAIMLAAVLLALGTGARLVPLLKSKNISIGMMLALAGILTIAVTPIIERFDYLTHTKSDIPGLLYINWLVLTLYVIGIPTLLLGTALPWLLDGQQSTRKWGQLYGFNAFASVLGSIFAGWVFLPSIGFTKTAWLIGAMIACTGIFITAQARRRIILGVLSIAALVTAIIFQSGIGHHRVQLQTAISSAPKSILKSYEGPDVTVTAVEHQNGERTLVIDGFVATGQEPKTDRTMFISSYMQWMGHLPMLLHPAPEKALVIAFGTGQTANAIREEKPASLDIVEINKRILQLAPFFTANEGVLQDPRVKTTVMDGRAYLRRTKKTYDVITLEPMPPTFAGVNALYSQEFYKLAHDRLNDVGIIAQWLPFHLLSPYYSASIAATFNSIFPNSVLWIDPRSSTGILLGAKNDKINLEKSFPGFKRTDINRPLTETEVKNAIYLDPQAMRRYSYFGKVIDDDNQLLSYGKAVTLTHMTKTENIKKNFILMKKAKDQQKQAIE